MKLKSENVPIEIISRGVIYKYQNGLMANSDTFDSMISNTGITVPHTIESKFQGTPVILRKCKDSPYKAELVTKLNVSDESKVPELRSEFDNFVQSLPDSDSVFTDKNVPANHSSWLTTYSILYNKHSFVN